MATRKKAQPCTDNGISFKADKLSVIDIENGEFLGHIETDGELTLLYPAGSTISLEQMRDIADRMEELEKEYFGV